MSSRRSNNTNSRLKQDYIRLKKDPVPYITAEPLPSNILEWHYVVSGPENTPYEGGYYHGKLVFPSEFPFKPPAIYMLTPNGRFKTNKKLCLSISDFHPDTWNPAWSVSTILTGLLSFMNERCPTLGSVESTDHDKRQFAYNSLEYNLKNKDFCELFPELVTTMKVELSRRVTLQSTHGDNSNVNNRSVTEQSSIQSCITNLIVIVGFAAFAFTVKYVMQHTKQE